MGTKRRDAVDPPRPLRDKESNRQGTDPTSPHPHLDENNLLWENQTTPLRGAPPRRDCHVDAGSSLEYCATTNLLPSTQRPVRVLQAGHKRGRVLQEEPKEFSGYTRLREVPKWRWQQTGCLLQGKQCQVPLLRQGMSEEEYCKMRPFTGGCEKYRGCCKAFTAECLSCTEGIREKDYCKKNPSTAGCEKYRGCCKANNAQCLSCAAGLSEEEYCKKNPSTGGCEKYRNCCQAYNAKCESCKQGISEEEFCKKNPSTDFFGGVQGCEKYHKGDGGKGCCKANTAECLACSEGKSVKRFCKKKRNRDVPGCEKYHGRGSWGKNDRDDSRQQGDG